MTLRYDAPGLLHVWYIYMLSPGIDQARVCPKEGRTATKLSDARREMSERSVAFKFSCTSLHIVDWERNRERKSRWL